MITKLLAHKSNHGSKRPLSDIKYIVIHYTGNKTDKAINNARYFQTPNRGASAHYFIDSDNIIQSVEDNVIAYSVGGNKYSNCKSTGGGTLYGICTNKNSLSVELCSTNGKFSGHTISNAVSLVKKLMRQYNVPVSRVIRHFDVTGKECPAYWIGSQEKEQLFREFKMKVAGINRIGSNSPIFAIEWLQYKIGCIATLENKTCVDGKYGVKTANNILDICKEKKWKPARNGMCVGKKMINYLKTV